MFKTIDLSICITTYNRGNFIKETLDSILHQLRPNIELIVVEGCSPDNTEEVMRDYVNKHPQVRYYREQENSGIDKDYDKAVGYAHGEYCWLMTDDDLVKPNAIEIILTKLNGINELVVLNAEVASVDFSNILDSKLIKLNADQSYTESDGDKFMADAGHGLSFIGCVIIKRKLWLARERSAYYGSLFVHVGVIFQSPMLKRVEIISEPLITIRYGNAMWTARSLEIWLVKWPNLIWSFKDYSDSAKATVCPIEYRKKLSILLLFRANGVYNYRLYRQFLSEQTTFTGNLLFKVIAILPPKILNIMVSFYCLFRKKSMKTAMYSLNSSKYQNAISRWASRVVGL